MTFPVEKRQAEDDCLGFPRPRRAACGVAVPGFANCYNV